MPASDVNLADRNGKLLESHKGYDPRLILFYFVLAGMLLLLAGGLAYQQLSRTGKHREAERQQNQRRVIYPGPRGNIYDRHGRVLVGNRPRFSVRLQLDALRREMLAEEKRIKTNYAALAEKDVPSWSERIQLARVSVAQRYLDQVCAIIGRDEKVDAKELRRHYERELLLPYTLLDDLTAEEYAKLWERLPVNSAAQVYTFSARHYPFGSAAAHTLGYVGTTVDIDIPDEEDFSRERLRTFKLPGTFGRDGIEKQFDERLQGEAGGAIFRVDPAGTRINPPLLQVKPKQGQDLRLSLDIDLQTAAEAALAETELAGSAVALDVATGEVLVLASKPDYDLTAFSPRISAATWSDVLARGAAFPRAVQGAYAPGSAFKILVSIAGLRAGVLTPAATYTCGGVYKVGNRLFPCHDRHIHGETDLGRALEKSCNVFFYQTGLDLGPERIAAEARRFHFDRPTGIELPSESRGMLIPDPAWKRDVEKQPWTPGDTANMSIGQGAVVVTPLQMACFAASVARDEVWTQPTIIHQAGRPRQRHEKIGLTAEQRAKLLEGMERVTQSAGTAHLLTDGRPLPRLPIRIAGKTGTAQKLTAKGTINLAWFIGFAPVENPEIAVAICIEGDTPGEETGGGRYASPVVHAILDTWLARKANPGPKPIRLRTE